MGALISLYASALDVSIREDEAVRGRAFFSLAVQSEHGPLMVQLSMSAPDACELGDRLRILGLELATREREARDRTSCRKCGATFTAAVHRAGPATSCDTTLCLTCCEQQGGG